MSRVEEIRRRRAAVADPPWGWFGNTATDQIYLGTRHSGRIILLMPHVGAEQFVWSHVQAESYTLEGARVAVPAWCGAHDADSLNPEPVCQCDDLRAFLADEMMADEGHRDYVGRDGYVALTRGVRATVELMLQPDHRDVRLKSHRQLARYEVLHGRTLAEHLAVGGRESDLYREDIVGLDSPEAELIAHAPDDIAWLLRAQRRMALAIILMAMVVGLLGGILVNS